TNDPDFHDGHYGQHNTVPAHGLQVARMLGHVTYLSDDALAERFGRELKSGDLAEGRDVEFQVESYLQHQGEAFSQRFDANTYIRMTRALDLFDPAADFGGDLSAALGAARCRFLIMSFSTDWRFSVERSQEVADAAIAAGRDVSHAIIDSPHGHDSFLLPVERYIQAFQAYMNRVAEDCRA
ncbi:MAG: homoserine O-acetyltransferase, partial [Pseudomonadota bacterium]